MQSVQPNAQFVLAAVAAVAVAGWLLCRGREENPPERSEALSSHTRAEYWLAELLELEESSEDFIHKEALGDDEDADP